MRGCRRSSLRPSPTTATSGPRPPTLPRRASNTESSARTSSRRSTPMAASRCRGDKDKGVGAQYQAGVSVPNFELDLFGRLRSLTDVQLNRYFATEAGARATRLTLVARHRQRLARPCSGFEPARISAQTAESAQKSVRLTRLRLEGGIAPRTDLDQAEQILATAQADLARQRTAVAQDVNALQLLVGAPIQPSLLAGSIDEAFGTIAPVRRGLDSYVLLRRPDVIQAEYRPPRGQCEHRRGARGAVPPDHAHRAARLCQQRTPEAVHRRRIRLERGAPTRPTRSSRQAPGMPTSASPKPSSALLSPRYQGTIQSAFRDVADALARRGTINDEIAARQRPAGRDRRRLSADRGSLQRGNRSLPDGARRAAFLLCGASRRW